MTFICNESGEDDERELHRLLRETRAKFILSTWHHNKHRKNDMIDKYWNEFNIITKDHFYHSGGKLENRQSVVEALVYNFDPKTDVCRAQERDLFSLEL